MNIGKQCEMLAASEMCTVERCRECGTIHLHMGATSLRFKIAAYSLLCQTLLAALAQAAPQMVEAETACAGNVRH